MVSFLGDVLGVAPFCYRYLRPDRSDHTCNMSESCKGLNRSADPQQQQQQQQQEQQQQQQQQQTTKRLISEYSSHFISFYDYFTHFSQAQPNSPHPPPQNKASHSRKKNKWIKSQPINLYIAPKKTWPPRRSEGDLFGDRSPGFRGVPGHGQRSWSECQRKGGFPGWLGWLVDIWGHPWWWLVMVDGWLWLGWRCWR